MTVPRLSSRDVQRYLDRGYDQQSAINAALADARKVSISSDARAVAKVLGLPAGAVVLEEVTPKQKPRAKSRDLEHAEQRQFFKHVRELEKEIPILRYVYAVPNGGKRSKATAGKMWAEGVRRGPPDINLDAARQSFHGFRGEQKAPGSEARTSDEQRDWHAELRRQAYFVTVEDTWEGMWNALVWYLELDNDYLQPMRGDSE